MVHRRLLALAGLLACLAPWAGAVAQQPTTAPPIRIIIEVPNDEAGRAYVTDKLVPKLGADTRPEAGTASPAPAPAANPPAAPPAMDAMMVPVMAAEELSSLRERAEVLLKAVPNVPDAIASGIHTFRAMGNRLHVGFVLAACLFFVGGGIAARRAAFWSARSLLTRILESPGATAMERVRVLGLRLLMSVYILTASVLGSVGAFLLFPWPPVFREAALTLLAVFIVYGLTMAFGRVYIAPGARHDYFRVLPLTTRLARYWFRWLFGIVMPATVCWATVSLLGIIGVAPLAREVVASASFALVVALMLVALWYRASMPDERPLSRFGIAIISVILVIEWLSFTLRLPVLFWTLGVFTVAPMLMLMVRASVRHVIKVQHATTPEESTVLGWAVVVERTLRVAIVVAGVSILAKAWGVNLSDIAMGETAVTRALRALLRIVVVLMVAELAWRLIRALIDGRMDGPPLPLHDETPEGRRRQRLRTLLPILRNFLLVMIATVTVLMVLDALGIQIGPLLAGAGVVGIAIGFGAQTLVKDIISGVFYLLDDAFRVGEYIQAGSHKGTVESFSLRSVKLRHHRGPISTVPFGELGAVQNMSRDWVIDKVTIGVTYDTDLDLARKIIKKVGQELAADPEFAPNIIEPLKMQGVEQMGEFAIQLRLKMMTRPGEQFVIRRKAYALIKKAFAENNIHFAFPTVQIAEGAPGSAQAAAAQQAVDRIHAAEMPKPA